MFFTVNPTLKDFMRNKINLVITVIVSTFFSLKGFSQNKRPDMTFGNVKVSDFSPQYYPVDSSAGAVYLFDAGTSHFEGDKRNVFSVIYERHARIRVLKKSAFDIATIKFNVYDHDFWHEQEIKKIEVVTYNLENGHIVSTELDQGSVFKERNGDNVNQKFTFPNIKEGCIIEFDYIISSPGIRYLFPWRFQGEYPRLWTEYAVKVPQFYHFVLLKRGFLSFDIDSINIAYKKYRSLDFFTIDADEVQHTWAIKNAPALKEESNTTTTDNYVSKIEFQLVSVNYPNQTVDTAMYNWGETSKRLMNNNNFGKQLGDDNKWLKDDISEAGNAPAASLPMARAIFNYVKHNYSCTDSAGLYLSQDLKKTYRDRKGNVADINILLAAMLKNNGFHVNPVILSTRSNGIANSDYPILRQYNYTLVQVLINDTLFLLDASNGLLGFGVLSGECYNGNAIVVSEDDPGIVNLSADSLKESKLTSVFLTNTDNGLSGGSVSTLSNMSSFSLRKNLAAKGGANGYFNDLKKNIPFDINISNTSIDSLTDPDHPVTIKYDLDFKPAGDIIYFAPLIAEALKENPFKAANRLYPVERPYCEDNTFTLNMEIPRGYKVEEIPRSAKVMLNENDGIFEYIIAANASRIQLRCRVVIKKANFLPDDYQNLRDFFAFIVKKEAEEIVFKKL